MFQEIGRAGSPASNKASAVAKASASAPKPCGSTLYETVPHFCTERQADASIQHLGLPLRRHLRHYETDDRQIAEIGQTIDVDPVSISARDVTRVSHSRSLT